MQVEGDREVRAGKLKEENLDGMGDLLARGSLDTGLQHSANLLVSLQPGSRQALLSAVNTGMLTSVSVKKDQIHRQYTGVLIAGRLKALTG